MRNLANTVLVIGVISMILGVILRLSAKPIALGLEPLSFLNFSISCFLLTIALNTMSQK